MTYLELIRDADRKLDKGDITLREYEKIIAPLNREIQPERKRGEWEPFDFPWFRCSECGAERENEIFMENFCPNCGADMREGNP